ncbi:MAG TPA: sulfatase-like hydrolase/transferase, partial [Bryobacteraceae bacterium]|nr:sulfatase-like hydrolase/transferase [Bryobacteraceae bacterium]
MKLRRVALYLAFITSAAAQTPVILISIDTLRADHVGAYGYRKTPTPNIDSFAAHGTLFAQADCQIPFTGPSHTTLLTSTYPFENGVEENAQPAPAGEATLATVLHARGYKTAAFVGSAFLEKEMHLDAGFDFYDSPFHFDAFSPISGSMLMGVAPGSDAAGRERRDGALVVRAARQWLMENRGAPLFAFVHLFDLHKPYSRGSYDGELAYVDGLIGTLKKALTEAGLWDKAIVILTADHGESLGDHGESSHGYFIYESTLHVPLMIHWPAGDAGHPERVEDPVGLIDVAPTVLDLLHVAKPASFEGGDLFGAHGAVYAESVHARDAFGWAPLRSLRVGEYKYIEAPHPELYDLRSDPGERVNLAAKDASKANELRGQLAKLMARYPRKNGAPKSANPGADALLHSLGYLTAGPRSAAAGPGADPKERLPEFHEYETAQFELYRRQDAAAIATLQRILTSDPRNLMARRDLGSAYLETGNYAKARAAFQQVLAEAPDDYVTNFDDGFAEEKLGMLP